MNLLDYRYLWDPLSNQMHILIELIILPFLIVEDALSSNNNGAQEAEPVFVNFVKPDGFSRALA
jgi:hypothetical protein